MTESSDGTTCTVTTTILLIVLIIMGIVWYSIKRHTTLTSITYWEGKNVAMHTQLYSLLEDVTSKLEINGIKPFLIGGSLLGSIRKGKIIAWDDDIDVAVYHDAADQADLVKKIKAIFLCDPSVVVDVCDTSLYSKDSMFGLKIYKKVTGEFVDIFLFSEYGTNGRVSFTSTTFRWLHPTMWLTKAEVTQLGQSEMNGKKYNCPSNTVNVIKRWFGDDAIEVGRVTHLHTGSIIDRSILRFFSYFGKDEIDMNDDTTI